MSSNTSGVAAFGSIHCVSKLAGLFLSFKRTGLQDVDADIVGGLFMKDDPEGEKCDQILVKVQSDHPESDTRTEEIIRKLCKRFETTHNHEWVVQFVKKETNEKLNVTEGSDVSGQIDV